MKYVALILILGLLLVACGREEITGDTVDVADTVEIIVEDPDEDSNEDKSAAEVLAELNAEAGLEANETQVEPEITVHDIEIINFAGKPEYLTINVGDTVKWTSSQSNYRHRIGVFYQDVLEGRKVFLIKPEVQILDGESTEYTFLEEGEYTWYSATNYPETEGTITVNWKKRRYSN